MKKVLLALLAVLLLAPALYATYKMGNTFRMGINTPRFSTAFPTGITGSTQMLGVKFMATTTSAITDVALYIDETGDISTHTYDVSIQSDNAGVPDGTDLGADKSFTTADDGWIALQTLPTNTGALTVGTSYWVVVDVNAGIPDGSNNIKLRSNTVFNNSVLARHHNGTNWTTTPILYGATAMVFKHADASYSGYVGGIDSADASGYTDIFDTNKQGIKTRFGSQMKILAFQCQLTVAGTPGNLTASVYEGSTLKYSSFPMVGAFVPSEATIRLCFDTPILLAANTDIYIILSQDGTSGSNDFDMTTYTSPSADYVEAYLPDNFRMVYGSGADPTAFTVSTTKAPVDCYMLISDPATDNDETAGGGGGQRVIGGGVVK